MKSIERALTVSVARGEREGGGREIYLTRTQRSLSVEGGWEEEEERSSFNPTK
jgi:hypothetical protein